MSLVIENHVQPMRPAIRFSMNAIHLLLAVVACAQTATLPKPPQLRAKDHVLALTLQAVNHNGRDAFAFNGTTVPPVLRLYPGDTLKIDYVNDLPAKSPESCAVNPCMDMTNLHFHGLSVSPKAPQDDVLGMIARPGQTLHYSVDVPRDHLPGLFWYHTHPHGESHRQALDGMSGAIIIDGMERYAPEIKGLSEQILIVRGQSIEHDSNADALKRRLEIPSHGCAAGSGPVEEIMTVNGAIRPQIQIGPREQQFWRIVNASADRYLDLQIDGRPLHIIALDGMPLAYHEPKHPTLVTSHYLVAPAGRIEAIVTGPPAESHAVLRTLCVNTGPDGDPNPGMVLADLVPHTDEKKFEKASQQAQLVDKRSPVYSVVDIERQKTKIDFTVTFTEDKNGFYINGQKFAMEAQPMTSARVGTYQHWRIVNATTELHPFHIHQVHFLAYAENGAPLPHPVWLDTVNVPVNGSADVILDFTNPVIKGMAVFHCHLLNHEDKGMMAKILMQ
jgi:suppressor of ftsI